MLRRVTHAFACSLGLMCSTVCAQENTVGLSKNPFSRPTYMVELQEAPSAVFVAEPLELRLMATLVSNGRPLANIDGEVLALGDTYEGYRLTWIGDGRIILMKDGERTTLDLHGTTEEDETGD